MSCSALSLVLNNHKNANFRIITILVSYKTYVSNFLKCNSIIKEIEKYIQKGIKEIISISAIIISFYINLLYYKAILLVYTILAD